jgi:methionyl-tRNA formyltransferase
MTPTVIFFGSFGKYSALVLENLLYSELVKVTKVVTTPPFQNKKKKIIKNEVQILAENRELPVFTPQKLDEENIAQFISKTDQADFIITAGYGKLLPKELLEKPKIGALNLHFSLLPKYRGANPGEWAILMNEKETGVSVIEMSEKFDAGNIIAKKEIAIASTENRETLYEKLYTLGGEVLPQVISDYAQKKVEALPQPETDLPDATRFKRADGFVDWLAFKKALTGESFAPELVSKKLQKIAHLLDLKQLDASFLERSIRALLGFPGIWTIVPTAKGEKRMKIFSSSLKGEKLNLNLIQIEGKEKTSYTGS